MHSTDRIHLNSLSGKEWDTVSEKYTGFVFQRTNEIMVLPFYSFFGIRPWKEPNRHPEAVTLNYINTLHFSIFNPQK